LLDRFDLYMGDICGNRFYAKLIQTVVHLRRETILKLLAVPGSVESSVTTRTALLQALASRDMQQARHAIDEFFSSAKHFYDSIAGE
jgi:GntR family transcriptional regulator, transcriptional repressor for pyruvate dehydrogenase complex